jgi:hypothetical protein
MAVRPTCSFARTSPPRKKFGASEEGALGRPRTFNGS